MTANGHIDEMCRFVSKDSILIAHISEEEVLKSKLNALNKERLDKAYEVLKSEVNFDGKPFNIVKMPFPKEKVKILPALSYCNFLITNGLIFAQKYYKEGMSLEIKRKDEEALKILQSVFPDRKVVAINTLALNLYGGGIHCNSRNIPRADKQISKL